jgi:myo-inositol-1(or 4)-monophosphatase
MKKGVKSPSLAALARTSVEAAEAAGAVLARHFGRKLDIREKPGAGLVTNADLAAEQAALRVLRRRFPEFGILTEESPPEHSASPGRFILDPLDGTTNFVHRFPMFCVSLAAEWAGQVVVGVIYHPILRETYLAIRGRGATVNGKTLRVSKTRVLSNSLLTTGFTYRKEEMLRAEMHSFARLSSVARAIRRPGSAALDLAYTARGVFDGFWERNLSPWDVAAGALLVEEAGGRVTDFHGKPFRVDADEILASNGPLHSALGRIIR